MSGRLATNGALKLGFIFHTWY
ncbi:MAG: hypothetical protein QOJ25_1424, partial [Solirubrobacteraceae bacterium]|nr:hypothetical protein [Solirubrobacteraceae bacterium]